MLPSAFQLTLPTWLAAWDPPGPVADLPDRMRLVLDLAARNVVEGTGGPFAAAVFERDTGLVVAVGVNRVVPENSSLAHAEVMAIGLADSALGTFDLGEAGRPRLQLVSSSQMCAMCLGAVVWSGVAEVVYGSTTADVVAIVGFDEGPTPARYCDQLERRGIHVAAEVLREEAVAVLRAYVDAGGVVYNAHH